MGERSISCPRCKKFFADRTHLARHLARLTPCRPVEEKLLCICGRAYSHAAGLYRHRASCHEYQSLLESSQTSRRAAHPAMIGSVVQTGNIVQNIHNTTTVNVSNIIAPITTNNVLNIGSIAATPPGWLLKWPQALVPPSPFPGFAITLDILRQVLTSREGLAEACQGGDSEAIDTLVVEIVRLVHAIEPSERNIFPNPNRADQVLVYVPGRWRLLPLQEAILLVHGHVAVELGEVLKTTPPQLQGPVRGAQAGLRAGGRVTKRTCAKWAALVRDAETLAQSEAGDGWLSTVAGMAPVHLAWFGRERHGHLTYDAFAGSLDLTFGLYREEDFEAADMAGLARRALKLFAYQLIRGHPENLTAVITGASEAQIFTRQHGWTLMGVGDVARLQARTLAQLLLAHLEAPEARVYGALARHVAQNLDALAEEEARSRELLIHFTQVAVACCKANAGIAAAFPHPVGARLAAPAKELGPPPAAPEVSAREAEKARRPGGGPAPGAEGGDLDAFLAEFLL